MDTIIAGMRAAALVFGISRLCELEEPLFLYISWKLLHSSHFKPNAIAPDQQIRKRKPHNYSTLYSLSVFTIPTHENRETFGISSDSAAAKVVLAIPIHVRRHALDENHVLFS